MAILKVRLTPRSGRTEIVGREGDAIYARVAAPPVDGAANAALIELLSEVLGIRNSAISIQSGHTSRVKHISVEGMESTMIPGRIDEWLRARERRK